MTSTASEAEKLINPCLVEGLGRDSATLQPRVEIAQEADLAVDRRVRIALCCQRLGERCDVRMYGIQWRRRRDCRHRPYWIFHSVFSFRSDDQLRRHSDYAE